MDTESDVETCGRCTMSTVVDTENEDSSSLAPRTEPDGGHVQTVSRRSVAFQKVRERVNDWAARITHGR